MWTRRKFIGGMVLLGAGTALGACAPAQQAPQQPAGATQAPAGQPRRGGQVTVGLHQEPDRLWGPITGLTVAQEVADLINEPLIRINERQEYVPALAEQVPSIENGGISRDGLVWTFKLRRGVKWHDGKPFTSRDVLFTYQTIMHPDVPVRGRVGWNQIESVDLPDDYTVVFRFKTLDAAFLDRVAIVTILPQHILGNVPPKDLATHEWFRTNRPGLGPFKFVEWRPGNYIMVERNPDYYVSGQPYLDRIVIKIITDANTLTNQLETGEVDIRFRMLNDQVPIVQRMSHIQLITTNATSPWIIWVNSQDPRLSDRAVRLALNYGFDRKALTGTVLRGLVQPAWSLIPPTSWAYSEDIDKFDYNPQKARQLLDEAGWRPGPDGIRAKGDQRLSFEILNIAGEQERVQILSFIGSQWKEIGIETRIKNVDVATMWGNALPRGQYEMAYSYTGRYVDPADLAQHYLCPEKNPTTNWGRYCNPQLDEILLKAQSTIDRQQRKTLYAQALKMINQDPAYVFVAWRADHTPVNKRLKGYKPAPAYLEMWNAAEWWVEQ